MADKQPSAISTSSASLLGASLGSAIALLIVPPIGFLLSIIYRSNPLFWLTLVTSFFIAVSGEYWIRRFQFRFDLNRQIVQIRSRWLLWPGQSRVIHFSEIQSFEVESSAEGSLQLKMSLRSGQRRIIKSASQQRLESLREKLSSILPAKVPSFPLLQEVPPAQPPVLQQEIMPIPTVQSTAPTTALPSSDLPSSSMQKLKIGIIGGSGLAKLLGSVDHAQKHEIHTPFGAPSDAIYESQWSGVPVFFLSRHGPGHLLNPAQVPYQANIYALKQLGCTHIIASGAVGSLREEMKPRDVAIPDQIIDQTTKRPATFFDNVAVHVEFSEPFCPLLRGTILEAAGTPTDHAIHDRGCYVAMEGPAFSTRAESLMHRLWGGDLIGMTAMPEARLAREAEISYAMVALVTDYDSWRQKAAGLPGQTPTDTPTGPFELLNEIIGNLETASLNAIALIKKTVELIATRQEQLLNAPSRSALRLAIWSDRAKIPPEEVARLHILWARHFELHKAE